MPDNNITRRDFLNGSLIAAGSAFTFASLPALSLPEKQPAWARMVVGDDWYGPGGIGDYADCHGNTPTVVSYAHSIRDGHWKEPATNVIETGEVYDVVIVGAGMAGLGAALEMLDSHPDKRVLILDNHSVFGGESKQNEFDINGTHFMAPQGANGFHVPAPYTQDKEGDELGAYEGDSFYYDRFNVPREFAYPELTGTDKNIRLCKDNYQFTYSWYDWFDTAHQFHSGMPGVKADTKPVMDMNSWQNGFDSAPLEPDFRAELLKLKNTRHRPYEGDDWEQWLDGMSYKDYLEKELGFSSRVTHYLAGITASSAGMGPDVLSAYGAFNMGTLGFNGYTDFDAMLEGFERHSFPGGNSGFARYALKELIPSGIEGEKTFEDILNGDISFSALDQAEQPVRMRLSATVTQVEHVHDESGGAKGVSVVYAKDAKVYRVAARAVVMAGGGWINKHVVRDMEPERRAAYDTFNHAPFLVANVALNNWKFLETLGSGTVLYPHTRESFGFSCNIREPMHVGSYQPPHNPNKPTVLTFYVPFNDTSSGLDLKTQCIVGRHKLYTTPYAEFEKQIRQQMNELFTEYGFDDQRDIDAVVLNRWGHAYVAPEPGFYFGRGGQPAARDIIRQLQGRIAYAHSELEGNQHYGPAAAEGRRAIQQLKTFF